MQGTKPNKAICAPQVAGARGLAPNNFTLNIVHFQVVYTIWCVLFLAPDAFFLYYKDKNRNESKERTRERKLCEKGGIAKREDELFAEESAQNTAV